MATHTEQTPTSRSADQIHRIADKRLDTIEAAKYLGVAPATLQVWRSTGRYCIPFLKIGGRVRYRLSDLDNWLKSRTRESGTTA